MNRTAFSITFLIVLTLTTLQSCSSKTETVPQIHASGATLTHVIYDDAVGSIPNDLAEPFLKAEHGSQLALWNVQSESTHFHMLVEIPRSFPAPVVERQRQFFRSVKSSLTNVPDDPVLLPRSACLRDDASGNTTATFALHGDHPLNGLWVPACTQKPPSHQAILVDLSLSALPLPEIKHIIGQCVRAWTAQSQLVPGSTCRVFVIGRTRDETLEVWSWQAPEENLGARGQSLAKAVNDLMSLEVPERPNSSAVLHAIHYATSVVNELPENHHKSLLIISDMRQVTLGENGSKWAKHHFESRLPEADAFVQDARTLGLLANLNGWTVVAIAHDSKKSNGEPFTAQEDTALRHVWKTMFAEMGCPSAHLYRTGETAFASLIATNQEVPHDGAE